MKTPTRIRLFGRRWWNRRVGQTYHSCEIWVDDKLVHKVEYAYGPDQMWEQNGTNWLQANGYLPGREVKEGTPGEALWRYCEREHIHLLTDRVDVARKKDL